MVFCLEFWCDQRGNGREEDERRLVLGLSVYGISFGYGGGAGEWREMMITEGLSGGFMFGFFVWIREDRDEQQIGRAHV